MTEENLYPPNPQKALEWITVLCAADLDYSLSQENGVWIIHVAVDQVTRAQREIAAFERSYHERMARPVVPFRRKPTYRSWMGLWAAHVLLLFYVWLGAFDAGVPVMHAACAEGGRILSGEWWRVVTALMLHSGPVHLVANMCFLLFLGQAVCRLFGAGLGLFLIFFSGAFGNMLVAWFGQSDYRSVGASTACFGALGILAVQQSIENYRRYRDVRSIWSRAWIPLGAGLALLGLMGTGPKSDLASHALGFVVGLMASIPVSWYGTGWLSDLGQKTLVLACVVIIAVAWTMAFLVSDLLMF